MGGKKHKIRWRQASGNHFLVDPHPELVQGAPVSGNFQAKGGLGVFRFEGSVAVDENYEHRKFDLARIDIRMDSLSQDQRREFSRAYFSPPLAASLRLVGDKKKKSVAVDIVNLSAAGAGVLSGEPLAAGAEIMLEFLIGLANGEENIRITGACVRRTDIDHPKFRYYVGVAFRFAGRRLPNELKRFEETQRLITRAVDQQNIQNAQRKERLRED